MDYPPFPGFRPQAFTFLRDLAKNNQRDWFKPRKSVYEDEILWPFKCLIADCARRATEENLPLQGDPERAVFRIYRDTRFSKDKSPYKTNTGAVLTRSGERGDTGLVYFHLEPARSFLAAGFWQPEADFVRQWRGAMAANPGHFRDLLEDLNASGLALETEAPLKRMPRGYEQYADTPFAEYYKWKSYIVSRPLQDEEMQVPDLTNAVVKMMRDSLPLLHFGWQLEPSRS